MIEYEDYLDRNFDGTNNSMHHLTHVHITSKANNEVCTLKYMLIEQDRMEFLKDMRSEVASLSPGGILKPVPRQEMKQYHAS